jgi:hypothetical protein
MSRADILRAYEHACLTLQSIDTLLSRASDYHMIAGLTHRKLVIEARKAQAVRALQRTT